jgi:hypothetical protein
MNQLDYIDQLRNNEVKTELILDHLACWFSADQIEEFFKDFVRRMICESRESVKPFRVKKANKNTKEKAL